MSRPDFPGKSPNERIFSAADFAVGEMTVPSSQSRAFSVNLLEGLLLLGAVVVLGGIKLVAHYRFGTSFDSALLGNVAWRLGNGLDTVSSLTGFGYFATHASIVLLPIALVFKVWPEAGLPITYLLQALSVGLVGLGVLRVAGAFELTSAARRLLLALTILSPGAFYATRLEVHEPTLGLGFLAMTLGTGLAKSPLRRMWWWPVLAAACRIEMAASTVVTGALLARDPSTRRVGAFTVFAGLGGLLVSLWFVSQAGTEAASVAAHFSHLGSTVSEVVRTAFTHPIQLLRPIAEPEMLSSIVVWLLPMGIAMPLIGWRYLLAALPMAGVAILGVWAPADLFPHHYWYGFLVAAPIATAEALRLRGDRLKALAITGLLGSLIGWAWLLAALPIIRPFGQPDSDSLRQMVAYVSEFEAAGVSAPDNVVPHLVGREALYAFPRPFLCSEESVGPFAWSGEAPEFVIVRTVDKPQIEGHGVLGSVLTDFYRVVDLSEDITVFRLRTPGLSGLHCSQS